MQKLYFTAEELKLLDAALIHLMIYAEKQDDECRKIEAYLLRSKIHKKRTQKK